MSTDSINEILAAAAEKTARQIREQDLSARDGIELFRNTIRHACEPQEPPEEPYRQLQTWDNAVRAGYANGNFIAELLEVEAKFWRENRLETRR